MAVIINEFQIVVAEGGRQGANAPQSPATGPGGAAPPQAQGAGATQQAAAIPGPREILDLLRHHEDRMARLRAE